MTPINWKPDRKILREFSEAGLFFLGMVACPLAYFKGHSQTAAAFWISAVVVRLVGLVRVEWLKPLFIGLTLLTWPIGWVVSKLALALLYYLLFTPIALLFRLIGRDALQRQFDDKATSYWEPYQPNRGLDRYLRPF